MDKNHRRSLTLRFQPRDGRPLAEVADWLNQMTKAQKNETTSVLLVTLLPYARSASGENHQEVERCYWQTKQRIDHYLYLMQQELRIAVSELEMRLEKEQQMISKEAENYELKPTGFQSNKSASPEKVSVKDIDAMFGI